jgi:predicted esterase
VTETPLDVQRVANERALLGVDTSDPAIFQALVAVHARNALLSDSPGESESARFLVNPIALSRELAGEINALLRGRDPFKNRAGDYWRVIPAGAMQIPARVYAPERALAERKSLPLIIALHGAGADENAFMDGYGGGEIKRLADKHGFVVVSPSTYWCTPNPAALKGMIDTLAFDYPIDQSRVYLLGHSLGAIAAGTMSQRDPDEVAAVVLLATKDFQPTGRQIPPTLLVAAELDPVFDPLALQAAAKRAQAAHLPVEFEMMKNYGHCNMPAAALTRAVEWLLAHRK